MSLSDLASVGSFVSGLAVVVTLIFLLLQMRQANLNQRALMQQMRSARSIDTILRQSDSYFSETHCLAYQNSPTLTEAQILSFMQSMAATFFNWEDSFLQLKIGTLDASSFESDDNGLRRAAVLPAFRVAWRMNREIYSRDFREYVDKVIGESRQGQPLRLKSTWDMMMSEELARTT